MKIRHVQITLGSIGIPGAGGNIEYFPVDETGAMRGSDRGMAQANALSPAAKRRIESFAAAMQDLLTAECFDYGQGLVEIRKTVTRIDPHTRDDPDSFAVHFRQTPAASRGEDGHQYFNASHLRPPLPQLWRTIMRDLRMLCWKHLQHTIYGETSLPPELVKPIVFLSYQREYDDFADPLARQLAEYGLEVFKDNWVLTSGDRFHAEIDDYLERCGHFVAVISPGYRESPECRREYAKIDDRQNEDSPPRRHPVYWKTDFGSSHVPTGWEELQGTRFGEDRIDFIEKVSELLEGI